MNLSRRFATLTPYGLVLPFVNAAVLVLALATASVATAADTVILALGDSLTAGYGLPREESFPARLQQALLGEGLAVTVLDGGVSGDTTAGGRARLDWVLAAAPGGRPHAVIVELGANDGLRGLEPAATEANLDAIVVRLKAIGARVLLTGMRAPPNLGRAYGAEFDALFPVLAARHGVAFYPFFLDGVAADVALNQADGKHPNKRGVAIIVERMLPYVKALIGGGE